MAGCTSIYDVAANTPLFVFQCHNHLR
jgi:hypothetical protein